MKTLHKRCAGLDVHKAEVVACLRIISKRRVEREVRRFPTTTQGLLALAEWLESAGCTHVAMEATGVYWKPVWHILEGRFALILANAAHVRNVPGRKSDVNDATWLADLLAHGLIRSSFVPPPAIQELRELTRTRRQLRREIVQHVQRIQAVLEEANIKLCSVITDIMGASAEFYFQPPGNGPMKADYVAGEDVVTGGLRSLADPGAYGDPDHYSKRYTGPLDNGGVHTNLTIGGHAFYLAVEGGVNRTSGLSVTGVGGARREQMEKIFYRAFTQMLPADATFATARAATIQSARDLYGADSPATRAVTEAWTAVGVN